MEPLPERTEAPGLEIRRWVPDDAEAVHQAITRSVDHLRPWFGWISFEPLDVIARRALFAEWERGWADGGDVLFGIWDHDLVLGSVGLHRRLGPGGLEIGYWVHVDHLGQGIAPKAAAAVTDLAFTVGGIDRVEIHHDVENHASRRVPAKLGFTEIETVEAHRDPMGPAETGVDVIWRMTKADWLSR